MNYDSKSHEKNNHPKHSLEHGYAIDGTYLGPISEIELVDGCYFDNMMAEGLHPVYSSETGQTDVYDDDWNLIAVYELVLSQHLVGLGDRKIA